MSTRLYVGNLSHDITEKHLAQAFGGDARRVTDIRLIRWNNGPDGRYGFAFVEMETEADVRSAIEAWDGSKLNGRTLSVAEVPNRRSRWNGDRSRDGAHVPEFEPHCS